MEVDTTVGWSLDYEQLPGCRLNLHAIRFFSVHPNEAGTYVISTPNAFGKLNRNNTVTDLTLVVKNVPAQGKAITAPIFVRKVPTQ